MMFHAAGPAWPVPTCCEPSGAVDATGIIPISGFHEPFSAMTHLLGAAVFAVLGIVLIRAARGDRLRVVCFSVYVFCSVFLLAMSGVYHVLDSGTTGRAVLGRLDYAAIFTLIAGTHTPVQGLFFRGFWRWAPLLLMWSAVATGATLFSVFYHEIDRGLGNAIFLFLGWMAGMSGLVVWRRLGGGQIQLLVGGGIAYSIGALVMGFEWPTMIPGVIGPHEIWHIAVLLAMAMHWKFLRRNAHFPTDGPVGVAGAVPSV